MTAALFIPPRGSGEGGTARKRRDGWGFFGVKLNPETHPTRPASPSTLPCPKGGILRRLTARHVFVAVLILCGLTLVGQGVYIQAKAMLAQVLLEKAFARSLAIGQPVKAWGWADTWPVARIEAPRLGASAIALQGASGEALAFGPGHLDGTPEAGDRGVAIYAAHRDTQFAFLRDVTLGDEIRVTRRDGTIARFRVTGTRVARWDASGLDPLSPGRKLALTTCWPFDATTRGPLRYVVEADLVE